MKRYLAVLLILAFAAPVSAVGGIQPYPSAPACPSHNPSQYHRLWDYGRGCHYDHEHGDNPFRAEVAAAFPGFDLQALLGGVQIGHGYPTSPQENTVKHGGFKWAVMLANPGGCVAGFEGAAHCVQAAVIQYHLFGNLSQELSGRVHSADVLLKICEPGATDCGYLFAIGHPDYGQRVTPYQGQVLAYPDNPSPAYGAGFGPYWSLDCVGAGPGCRPSLAYILSRNLNVNSVITNKPTGIGVRPDEPALIRLLIRTRDNYQVIDSADLSYPFTFRWVCGDTAYQPAGCRYNNSTTRPHEAGGTIPAAWDGAEWDTDPRVGYVTGAGLADGFPFKAVGVLVGKFGSELTAFKVSNPTPASNPERDYYFLNGQLVSETTPGAVPSGWIGSGN
jgi:hypothetical protein